MPPYYLGLPMWSHRSWQERVYGQGCASKDYLRDYSQVFSTVEGNTTFYATPDEKTVANWAEHADKAFRFCFKLPKTISHENALRRSGRLLTRFLMRLEPLADQLGPFMIQLPEGFTPEQFVDLKQFVAQLPAGFQFSVEVRHPQFFNRGDEEQALNQLLQERQVDRVCFDSRPLFSLPAETEADHDARRKKPRLPVHAVATGQLPLIRFIGSRDNEHNQQYWQPWINKITQWVSEGKRPYVFVHTPDNSQAPQLADLLNQSLQSLPGWQPLKLQAAQDTQMGMF